MHHGAGGGAGRKFPVVGMPFIMTTVVMLFTPVILIVIGTMMVMIMVRSLPRGESALFS